MLPRDKISCVGFQTIPRSVPSAPQFMLDGMAQFKSWSLMLYRCSKSSLRQTTGLLQPVLQHNTHKKMPWKWNAYRGHLQLLNSVGFPLQSMKWQDFRSNPSNLYRVQQWMLLLQPTGRPIPEGRPANGINKFSVVVSLWVWKQGFVCEQNW
jgi:hypothetical protein